MKDIFKIILTVSLLGLGTFALIPFLNNFLQTVITYFNIYLDGMFQFTQYFAKLKDCDYLILMLVFIFLTIIVSIYSR